MKKSIRSLALLLVVATLLCGCGGQTPAEQNSTAATEPTRTEAPAVTTEEALRTALEANGRITVEADIQLDAYVTVKEGSILDGGGHTITGPKYDEEDISKKATIVITKGTLENVTVKGEFKAIGNNGQDRSNGDVRLNNVTADSAKYALWFGESTKMGRLHVNNSTLRGWTVYNWFEEAQFTNTTFGWNEDGSYGQLTAYNNTTLIGCHFEGGTDANGRTQPYTLTFKKNSDGIQMVLEDCYVGDTLITQENINRLLKVVPYKNTVQVMNTTG